MDQGLRPWHGLLIWFCFWFACETIIKVTTINREAEIKRHEIQLKTWQAVEKAGYKEVR